MNAVRRLPALFALALAAATAADIRAVEQAIETQADAIVLPSGPLSTLVVRPCAGCPPLALLATASSQYFIGEERVTLDELRRELARRPGAQVVVLYLRESNELRRLFAAAR